MKGLLPGPCGYTSVMQVLRCHCGGAVGIMAHDTGAWQYKNISSYMEAKLLKCITCLDYLTFWDSLTSHGHA